MTSGILKYLTFTISLSLFYSFASAEEIPQGNTSTYITVESIRTDFPEFRLAEKELAGLVSKWKETIGTFDKQIDKLSSNSLRNQTEIDYLVNQKQAFSYSIFSPNGEYDKAVERIFKPIESKLLSTFDSENDNSSKEE